MWVECPDAGLQHVPRGLDTGTQVLVLSGNPLSELEARAFERVDLRNLQRLHMVNCRLHDINVDALQQLSNLIELDLAQNDLTALPTPALMHTPILRKLSLARNKIRAIKNEPFSQLKHLQSIDLSGNGIEHIDQNAFYGVRDLKHLYLHENRLRSIDGKTMRELPSVLELTLQHNPWQCDCGLRAFRDWMMERDISISYSPNCSAPSRLAGKAWSALDLDEFACQPDVISVDTEVTVYEGENASIGCVMAAIPNVHIEWQWRGRPIRNMSLMTFGRQMYLIRESSSPAGIVITGELLPTQVAVGPDKQQQQQSFEDNTFNLAELVQEHKAGNSLVSERHKALLDSLIDANNAPQRRFISSEPLEPETFQSSARAQQSPTWLAREKRSLDASDDDTYKRTSTLYIMNALEKDSGSYICIGSNKAGTVSANVTLTVLRRLEVTAAAYSGEEVAGIVLGALFVFLLTFVAICFVVLRSKNGSNCHRTGTTGGSSSGSHHQTNGASQTGLQTQALLNGTTVTPATNGGIGTNGRIPNGNAQKSPAGMCNGGGTLRRLSNTSTDTKDSKLSSSNLLISSSGSASNTTTNTNSTSINSGSMTRGYVGLVPNGEERKGALTIRTNQLAEQIELCNYGGKTGKDNLGALNQAAFSEHSLYGSNGALSSGSFSKLMLAQTEPAAQHGHYLGEDTNFEAMLNDNMVLANSGYGANAFPTNGRHYPSGGSPIANGSSNAASRHYGGSHYPVLLSNHTTGGPPMDHYHSHASCSGPNGKHSPSPVHYGNAVATAVPLKSLATLASNNMNSANADYFDYYGGPGPIYGSMAAQPRPELASMPSKLSNSTSASLQSHDPVDEFNKRRAAASVAEELQQRMAAAGVTCPSESRMHKANIELLPPHQAPSGQVVQFANSATVYSYSPSGPVSISAKQAASPALSRVRNGANGPVMAVAMALDARDSPDEGLGEETDTLE